LRKRPKVGLSARDVGFEPSMAAANVHEFVAGCCAQFCDVIFLRRKGFMNKFVMVLAVLAVLVAPRPASADLLVNGSFETGTFSGWTVTGGATAVQSAGGLGNYNPESGNFYAALGTVGLPLGTLAQTFATMTGDSYTLSYYLASNGTTPNEFKTVINGSTYFDQVNISPQAYTHYSYSFTATGSSSTVTFSERDDPNYLALDNVSVTQNVASVPEPSTFIVSLVGGLAFCGYGLRSVRRRAASDRAK
jgi:hypothetical protein